MVVDAYLNHHRRGHWSLQWQDPQRNMWRVEHFKSEKEARDFARFYPYDWNITKRRTGHYSQIGYTHGN
jgi:hypothetical protein